MSWGIRPDKRFRLAVGSFIEEYRWAADHPLHPLALLWTALAALLPCCPGAARARAHAGGGRARMQIPPHSFLRSYAGLRL
jgi:hypothetical protein